MLFRKKKKADTAPELPALQSFDELKERAEQFAQKTSGKRAFWKKLVEFLTLQGPYCEGCTKSPYRDLHSSLPIPLLIVSLFCIVSIPVAGYVWLSTKDPTTASTAVTVFWWALGGLPMSFYFSMLAEKSGEMWVHEWGFFAPKENPQHGAHTLSTTVQSYLANFIETKKREYLGDNAEFMRYAARLRSELEKARAFKERFAVRLRGWTAEPPHLRVTYERAEARVKNLEAAMRRVDTHTAKMRAYFDECGARIQELERPLGDLALIQEFNAGEPGAEEAVRLAEEMIFTTTLRMHTEVTRLVEGLNAALEGAATRLAVEAASTGDIARDIRVLEETLRTVIREQKEAPEMLLAEPTLDS